MSSIQLVNVSAGASEYSWPRYITETTGKDISADAVTVAFSTDPKVPGQFNAQVLKTVVAPNKLAVGGLISGLAPGLYYMFIQLNDAPETLIRSTDPIRVI